MTKAPYKFQSAAELSPFPDAGEMSVNPDVVRSLKDDDRRMLWKPFTQMLTYENAEPVIVQDAYGMWLRDIDGRSYLDGVSSLWVNLHGHRRPELDDALTKQLNRVAHSTMLGPSNVPAVELARELLAIAPSHKLTRVFYSDSGSTAVEIALKMTFQYWQQHDDEAQHERTLFIHLDDAYHGDTIGSVSVGGMELFHGKYGPLLFRTDRADSPYCYRCPAGASWPGCRLECLQSLEEAFARNEGQVAALVIEPMVQGAAGMRIYPAEYLRGAAQIARRHGALLIADEVATGFGRTGRMFACQHAGIEPDLLAVAKGLSGGYLPLAATLATEEIYGAFKGKHTDYRTFFHGHSFTGNPLACAVATVNLQMFRDLDVMDWVIQKIAYISPRLEAMRTLDCVGNVRTLGLMIGIELVADKDSGLAFDPALQVGNQVCLAARERGVLIRPLGDVVVLLPPLNTSNAELDLLFGVTHECIAEITQKVDSGA